MLLGQADLCKEAVKFESKELKESKFHPAFMSELEALLLDVYTRLLPTASEYEQRKQLIQAFNISVKSTFGNIGGFPVVEAFGSFIMNIFTATSDLDLSINFNNSRAICFPRDQAVSVLRSFAKVLYKGQRKGHLSGVLPVMHARVPVLKAVDCKTGIECDISVENKDGISRSLFFSIISSVDERFRIMSYLMKAWAKANDINSSKDRTMNSLSIISLVAFHFQTRDPPILPPFSTLLGDGTDVTNLRNVVLDFKNFGVRNKESVAELFVSLLAKLSSVEKLWELGLCASTFEGSWISKTWASKVGIMSVEDFLDRSQNFARSVGKSEMPKIYDCLRGSLKHLTLHMQGQIDLSALRSALFGSISFDALSNHVNSNAAEIIKLKLTVQPRVDINNKINNANSTARVKRKQTNSKSAAHHTNSSIGMTLKRKLPGDESVQPQFKNTTSKRTRYTEATGASRFGSHQSQSTTYLPNPIRYPVLHYAPPQPINGVGYLPHRDRDPKPPIAPNMGHAPHYLVYASQYHSTDPRPVQHVYGSQGLQYVPNPVHPAILNSRYPNILPGYNGHNTGHHNLLVPPRSFGSNHL